MIQIVIDAKNATLGRLASYTAKQALLGKSVIVVNCSEIVIVGNKQDIIKDYRVKRRKGGSALKGPFFPKTPEKILKRTIRGMVSYRQASGSNALKRIKCYNDTPEEFAEAKKITAGKEKTRKTITLKELSEQI